MSTMSTVEIRKLFGGPKRGIPADAVGVEVEAEYGEGHDGARISNDTITALNDADVRYGADGSLRNGVEFVTPPISLETLEGHPSWNAIQLALVDMHARTDSPRTSVHVHLNMSHKTYLDVVTLACVYWSLEQVLLRVCDEYRRGNMFALTITDSQTNLDLITRAFKEDRPPRYSENDHKYSSFNFCPLGRFGTVEIRIMNGLTSIVQVIDWALLCGAIRTLATKFKTPNEVMATKPMDLYNEFMSLLKDDNHWKRELFKFDPLVDLNSSRVILEAWCCSKNADFWAGKALKSGGELRPPSREPTPEMDFKYVQDEWIPINIEEDM